MGYKRGFKNRSINVIATPQAGFTNVEMVEKSHKHWSFGRLSPQFYCVKIHVEMEERSYVQLQK